ncbi:sulfite exporter TauE/SafE family protein [Bengtsoniella intestinalis]|uniref:sulfite exporter TauE/SafE family protein n=1 Tax=Bengtsoniella intestinalis TaxID=3073143 RepID=UPI00391F226A
MEYVLIAAVCLVSSIIGALCGIGGGVVIKPVLDSLGLMSVSTASFLSGLTVLSMSCYTITLLFMKHEAAIKRSIALPLCAGAVVGGIAGKIMFNMVSAAMGGGNTIGAIQAACLFVLVGGTLCYTFNKHRIHQLDVDNVAVELTVGLVLGLLSAFLGIGGGPFNLIALSFLFSMPTKVAAQNSLLIILCSQIASVVQTIATSSVPEFSWVNLILMASMGVLGAVIGRSINKKISDETVDKLFSGLNVVIMFICVYNFFRYL